MDQLANLETKVCTQLILINIILLKLKFHQTNRFQQVWAKLTTKVKLAIAKVMIKDYQASKVKDLSRRKQKAKHLSTQTNSSIDNLSNKIVFKLEIQIINKPLQPLVIFITT